MKIRKAIKLLQKGNRIRRKSWVPKTYIMRQKWYKPPGMHILRFYGNEFIIYQWKLKDLLASDWEKYK